MLKTVTLSLFAAVFSLSFAVGQDTLSYAYDLTYAPVPTNADSSNTSSPLLSLPRLIEGSGQDENGRFHLNFYHAYPYELKASFDTTGGVISGIELVNDAGLNKGEALAIFEHFILRPLLPDSVKMQGTDMGALFHALTALLVQDYDKLTEGMASTQPPFSIDQVKGEMMQEVLELGEVLSYDKFSRKAWLRRGYLYYKLGEWEKCAHDLTWYIDSLRPDVLSGKMNDIGGAGITDSMMVSQMTIQNKELKSAMNTQHGRRSQMPGYVAYWRGIALMNQDKIKLAQTDLETNLKYTSEKDQVALMLGLTYYKQSDLSNADKYMKLAAETSSNYNVLFDAGRYFMARQDLATAETVLRQALTATELNQQLQDKNPALYHLRKAKALRRLGDLKTAELSLNKSIVANPDIAETYYELGLIRVEQGHKNDACMLYGKCKFSGFTPDLLESETFPCP